MATTTAAHTGTDAVREHFPKLIALRLSELELAALRRQGFVSTERRSNTHAYKLRFRVNGKQHIRFLGADKRLAFAVEAELDVLQRKVRLKRKRAALGRAAVRGLKAARLSLQPVLDARGYHFHGWRIRKRRAPKPLDNAT